MEISSSNVSSNSTQVPVNTSDPSVNTDNGTEESSDSGSTSATDAATDFSAFMAKALGKTGQAEINEEELFAALIEQRLSVDNKEAADVYSAEKAKLVSGGMSYEDAGKAGLKAAVASGKMTLEEAEKVHAYAFKAAQLDSNTDELWDGTGGSDDPTKAVAAMETALLNIQTIADDYEKGAITLADPMPLEEQVLSVTEQAR
jgi:hypothetical protein